MKGTPAQTFCESFHHLRASLTVKGIDRSLFNLSLFGAYNHFEPFLKAAHVEFCVTYRKGACRHVPEQLKAISGRSMGADLNDVVSVQQEESISLRHIRIASYEFQMLDWSQSQFLSIHLSHNCVNTSIVFCVAITVLKDCALSTQLSSYGHIMIPDL